MSEHKEPIPSMVYNAAIGGHVTTSQQIIDENENKEQSQINSEVKQALGKGGSVDERIGAAVNIEKTRAEEAESALDGRVDTLEEAVGTGGSVDSRISAAVATETTRAQAAEADRYTKSETYTKEEVHNLITTPSQKYVSVTATAQTTAVTDVLPATGAADTTYRVGNWDGTQYNDSVFSEYAWNGSAYVKLGTKSQVGEVYDISANHADTKYADLSAALGTNGANIPQSLRKGGMSVKFVLTSDNKYVQARCMAQNFTTDVTQWQLVDKEPTAGSDNLVKSGGVEAYIAKRIKVISTTFQNGNIPTTGQNKGIPDTTVLHRMFSDILTFDVDTTIFVREGTISIEILYYYYDDTFKIQSDWVDGDGFITIPAGQKIRILVKDSTVPQGYTLDVNKTAKSIFTDDLNVQKLTLHSSQISDLFAGSEVFDVEYYNGSLSNGTPVPETEWRMYTKDILSFNRDLYIFPSSQINIVCQVYDNSGSRNNVSYYDSEWVANGEALFVPAGRRFRLLVKQVPTEVRERIDTVLYKTYIRSLLTDAVDIRELEERENKGYSEFKTDYINGNIPTSGANRGTVDTSVTHRMLTENILFAKNDTVYRISDVVKVLVVYYNSDNSYKGVSPDWYRNENIIIPAGSYYRLLIQNPNVTQGYTLDIVNTATEISVYTEAIGKLIAWDKNHSIFDLSILKHYGTISDDTITISGNIQIVLNPSLYNRDCMIITSLAKYSDKTKPANIYYSVGAYTSCKYTIGGESFKMRQHRIPPAIGLPVYIYIEVPSGTTLTLKDFHNSFSNVINNINGGMILNAHRGLMFYAPADTAVSFSMASQCGFRGCITIPKVTSDGVMICMHDDSIDETHGNARDSEGNPPSTHYGIANTPYDTLNQYDYGRYLGVPMFYEQKIPLLNEFFEICAKTGMNPVLSVHPALTTEQWQDVKSMLETLGILDKLMIKADSTETLEIAYGVLGDDIYGYSYYVSEVDTSDNTSVEAYADEMDSLNIGNVRTKEIEYRFANINSDVVSRTKARGYNVSVWQTGRLKGSDYKNLMELGISQITEDYNYSTGLDY